MLLCLLKEKKFHEARSILMIFYPNIDNKISLKLNLKNDFMKKWKWYLKKMIQKNNEEVFMIENVKDICFFQTSKTRFSSEKPRNRNERWRKQRIKNENNMVCLSRKKLMKQISDLKRKTDFVVPN